MIKKPTSSVSKLLSYSLVFAVTVLGLLVGLFFGILIAVFTAHVFSIGVVIALLGGCVGAYLGFLVGKKIRFWHPAILLTVILLIVGLGIADVLLPKRVPLSTKYTEDGFYTITLTKGWKAQNAAYTTWCLFDLGGGCAANPTKAINRTLIVPDKKSSCVKDKVSCMEITVFEGNALKQEEGDFKEFDPDYTNAGSKTVDNVSGTKFVGNNQNVNKPSERYVFYIQSKDKTYEFDFLQYDSSIQDDFETLVSTTHFIQ